MTQAATPADRAAAGADAAAPSSPGAGRILTATPDSEDGYEEPRATYVLKAGLFLTFAGIVVLRPALPHNTAFVDPLIALMCFAGIIEMHAAGSPATLAAGRCMPWLWVILIGSLLGLAGVGLAFWGTSDLVVSYMAFLSFFAYWHIMYMTRIERFAIYGTVVGMLVVDFALMTGNATYRQQAYFAQPNYPGNYMVMAAAVLFFYSKNRWLRAFAVVSVIIAILETGSFGAMALLATYLLVLAWRSIAKHSAILVLALVLLLAGTVFYATGAPQSATSGGIQVSSSINSTRFDRSQSSRFQLWAQGCGRAAAPSPRRGSRRRAVEEAGLRTGLLPAHPQRHAQLCGRARPDRLDRAHRALGGDLEAGQTEGHGPLAHRRDRGRRALPSDHALPPPVAVPGRRIRARCAADRTGCHRGRGGRAVPRPRGLVPELSVVVVAYDMARELPRTLRSLAPRYQRAIDRDDYEVVLVDNGSPAPVDPDLLRAFDGHLRAIRVDSAAPSPAAAADLGLAEARGKLIGLVVDGARMASPGLLATAQVGARLAARCVVATLGWHLGATRHMDAVEAGWDQQAEDEMLAGIDWERDGYQLFEVSTLAASSSRGWFGSIGESSALFLPRAVWDELGGLDERFDLPGGGLVNHDLYRRACELDGTELVVLLGEGTFHQFHGGAATSRQLTWEVMHDQYEELRGKAYRPPARAPLYAGRVRPEILGHLRESVRLAERRAERGRSAQPVDPGLGNAD